MCPDQVAGGFEMLGDQCCIFLGGPSCALFDGGSEPPMQFRTIRLELRFVRNRPNQRVMEGVFRSRREFDLIDELRLDQRLKNGSYLQSVQQITSKPGTDDRCSAQRAFRHRIEAIDARGDRRLQGSGHAHICGFRRANVRTAVAL